MIRTTTTRPAGPLLAVALFAGACSSAGSPEGAPPPPPQHDLDRLEAIYEARADSARMNVHEADVAFMSGMIHHHAQALVMSRLAPTNGASPSIRTLTGRIINAQTDEIAVMQRWLEERGRAAPQVAPDGTVTMPHMPGMAGHMDHDVHMPGMLTEEQLEELRNARGREYDRLFLTYMIQHHNGAVAMVHELFATDGAAQDDLTFKLASDIQVDQRTEVARMQLMLDAIPAN